MARPKGVPNKFSGTAKENIIAVFTRLGGTAEMAKWAADNQSEFYRIYARLLPTEVQAVVEHTVMRGPDGDSLHSKLESALSGRAGGKAPRPTVQ